MTKTTKALWVVAIIWAIILLALIIPKEITVLTGRTVMLKASPVDPRDLFRGDYLTLEYEQISKLNFDKMPDVFRKMKLIEGREVYTTIAITDKYGYFSGFAVTEPNHKDLASNECYIKGKIKKITNDNVYIKYGIESFFVPENKGLKIERENPDNLAVQVKIDNKGNIIAQNLYIDEQKVIFKEFK